MVEATISPSLFMDLDYGCSFDQNGTFCNDMSCCNGSNMTDEIYLKVPAYYSLNYQIVGTIVQSIILIVGVVGNTMVVMVVTQTRSMHTPTNCYLVSLAVADLMLLIATVPNEILAYYLLGDEWIWGRFGCGILIFLGYFGINVSSLSITAFTIERYIAICHPMRAQIVCTVSRAKRIILGVWLFGIVYCSPWLFLTKIEPLFYQGIENAVTCTYALSRKSYLGYFFADLVLFYVLPLLLSCVLYGLIARVLFSSDIQKSENGKNNGMVSSQDSKKNSNGTNARVQVVKMLIVVVAVFASLWLPYRVLLVYNSLARKRYMELWFLMFCKAMVYMNSAINPILYSAMSVKFRRAFKRMLSCGKIDKKSRGPYHSVAGSMVRKQHQTVTSQVTSCTVEQMEQLL